MAARIRFVANGARPKLSELNLWLPEFDSWPTELYPRPLELNSWLPEVDSRAGKLPHERQRYEVWNVAGSGIPRRKP